jgi:hypothetical protein
MLHAMHSVLGSMGPLRHMGVLLDAQRAQRFNRFVATGRLGSSGSGCVMSLLRHVRLCC